MRTDTSEIDEIDVIGLTHRVLDVLIDQQNGAARTARGMQ
jgi:hypothetical protein